MVDSSARAGLVALRGEGVVVFTTQVRVTTERGNICAKKVPGMWSAL